MSRDVEERDVARHRRPPRSCSDHPLVVPARVQDERPCAIRCRSPRKGGSIRLRLASVRARSAAALPERICRVPSRCVSTTYGPGERPPPPPESAAHSELEQERRDAEGIGQRPLRHPAMARSLRIAWPAHRHDQESLASISASRSPQERLSGGHCVNNEVDALGRCDAHFEHPPCRIRADDHCQVIKLEYSYRVSVGVAACRRQRPRAYEHSQGQPGPRYQYILTFSPSCSIVGNVSP